MNFNKVIIGGRVTRDPELTYTPSQTAVCNIGMAVNKEWKDAQGQKQKKVCFVDCVCFGKRADTLNQYVKKGDPLIIEGELELDQWEDRQTGAKRSKHKINVTGFTFCGGGEKREPTPGSDEARTPAHQAPPSDAPAGDDIPF